MLAPEKYEALVRTVDRDCKVLQSFGIMDYSLLVGIHNMDAMQKEKTKTEVCVRMCRRSTVAMCVCRSTVAVCVCVIHSSCVCVYVCVCV